ncbi:MAG TPA: hypothetical protein VGR47_05765 [Terracidiphilus sp.]|nr:hypothetical protein [Terracidiphilus sp.]
MTKKRVSMSCSEFQKQLPKMVSSGESAAAHPHVQVCERCRSLVAELEMIAEAARNLFPPRR